MRKRWLSLLLALVMLASVTVTTASADTVNLLDKTVTLSVTPSQSAICVGSTGDVYVTYTISIASDDGKTPIPAFSFVVPTDGKLATQAQTNNSDWYYWFNTDELMQWDEAKETGGHGPYKVAGYTKSSGYVGVGGSDNNGITEKTTVMTIVAKFPAGAEAEIYAPAFAKEDFIAGGGEAIDGTGGVKVSNAFGTRNVQVDPVTVNPGATVSGTVKDSSGKAVSGATVELHKNGTKVADATAGTDGKYTISNVSTGTYTVKAKNSDGTLNGSADVTVKADSILNADVTVAKGFTVSGTAVSWNNTNDALYYLYPSTMEDAAIKAEWKSGSYTGTACTSKGTPTASGKQFEQTFTFDTVAAGDYKLAIVKPGHGLWIEELTVNTDNITDKSVQLYKMGDVNKDGKVNSTDALWVRQSSAGGRALDAYQKILADLNRDGKANSTDALWIRQISAGSRTLTY